MTALAIQRPRERDLPRNMDEIMERRISTMIEERLNKRINDAVEKLSQYFEAQNRSRANEMMGLVNERLQLFVNQIAQPIDDIAIKLTELGNQMHALDLELAGLATALQKNGTVTADELVESYQEVKANADKAIEVARSAREAAKEMEENFPEPPKLQQENSEYSALSSDKS